MAFVHESLVSCKGLTGYRTTLKSCTKGESSNSCNQKMDRRAFAGNGLLSVAGVIIAPPHMSTQSEQKDEGLFSRTHKKIFAEAMEHTTLGYETSIANRKKELFSRIKDSDIVVDIGLGTGPNLKYMPKGIQVFGVEPNRYMWPYAAQKAGTYNINLNLVDGVAENLPIEDSSCDVVITTLTLCSVEDLGKAIQEILRIMKPGGQHLFIEHVIASKDRPIFRGVQNALNPFQVLFADGCHLNRNTGASLDMASNPKYSEISFEEFDLLTNSFIDCINPARPHICGSAQKASL